MKLTQEIIEKAKAAESAEELLAIAKESGIDMTADEAVTYFAQLHPSSAELSDNELDAVSGGGCNNSSEKDEDYEDKNQWLVFTKL